MSTTTHSVADRIARLIEKAPAGGIFNEVTIGPVESLYPNPTGKALVSPVQTSFEVFIAAGEEYRITVERV